MPCGFAVLEPWDPSGWPPCDLLDAKQVHKLFRLICSGLVSVLWWRLPWDVRPRLADGRHTDAPPNCLQQDFAVAVAAAALQLQIAAAMLRLLSCLALC